MNKVSIVLLSLLLTPLISFGMKSKKRSRPETDAAAPKAGYIQKKPRLEYDPEIEMLVKNINTRVDEAQKHLLYAMASADHAGKSRSSIALILDIDDTCIHTAESFELMIKNPASPYFDEAETRSHFKPSPILPILSLFEFAMDEGVKVIFLTARPENDPRNPTVDWTPDHQDVLEAAGYPVDNEQTFLICMPVEIYQEATRPENIYKCAEIIGDWKKSQHDYIEETYDCTIAAVLDDQPANLDRKKQGHLRIPCAANPYTTPQQQLRKITSMKDLGFGSSDSTLSDSELSAIGVMLGFSLSDSE